MIHKFEKNGIHIVMDVNSGAIHIVDEIVSKILDYYPEKSDEMVCTKLKESYDLVQVEEGLEEVKSLIDAGQLYSEDYYTEDSKFERINPVIKAMCLHVAHDCNLRCAYCFGSQGDFEGKRSLMDADTGKKALKFLCENSGNRRNLEVDFFGGEPLMNMNVVKELVTYGRTLEKEYNKHFRFTLTTNGVLLNDENIAYINEHMDNVVLSLDGRKSVNDKMRYTVNGSGSYDVILPNIKKMVEARKDKMYYVRGTFTRYNTDFAEDVLHMANQGFKQVSVEPVVTEAKYDYALTKEDLPVIFEQYDLLADEIIKRKNTDKEFDFFHFAIDLNQGPCLIKRVSGCGAGLEYVAVTPEGDIYPCHQFVGNEDFKMGSVHLNEPIVQPEIVKSFKDAHVYNKEACKKCWAKFYCSGGCHANAYHFNKDVTIPYDLGCEMERKRLECSLYVKAKLLLEAENQ